MDDDSPIPTRRRMRLLGSLLAVLILCLALPAPALAEPPRRLRVLVYNMHHAVGNDEQLDIQRIAGVIERVEPDLVALQEVDRGTRRTGGMNQPARLEELTGLHAAFGKAIDYQGGAYGQAILSRWPIRELRVHMLPGDPDQEQRIAVSAIVQPGGGGPRIRFITTHLDAGEENTDRLAQAAALNALFASNNSPTLPTILAGDFNAEPGSKVMKKLLGRWTDAAAAAGSPQPTYPAPAPWRRIDYVLLRPAESWRVVKARVVNAKVASDHRPLLVVLERTGDGGSRRVTRP